MRIDFAEQATGVTLPRAFLALDASVLDRKAEHEAVREDIKRNGIRYEFPDGLNQLDLIEECRALTKLDDFDLMYDLTMQMLTGKSVTIYLHREVLCHFQVVDRYQNLRGIDTIDEYPCLVTWLTEFIGAHIAKKYPLLGKTPSQPQAAETTSSDEGTRTTPETAM